MSLEARAMRFGKFVWGRNPETLQVEYQRNVKRLTLPQTAWRHASPPGTLWGTSAGFN